MNPPLTLTLRSRPAEETAPAWERTYTNWSAGCLVPQRCSMSEVFEIFLKAGQSFYKRRLLGNVEAAHLRVGVCPT